MRSLFTWIVAASLFALLLRSSETVQGWVGAREETRTSRWADGVPKETAAFRDGVRHGPCERFHPDGGLRARGTFRDGAMEGEWRFYGEDGELDPARSGIYEGDRRVAPLGNGSGALARYGAASE